MIFKSFTGEWFLIWPEARLSTANPNNKVSNGIFIIILSYITFEMSTILFGSFYLLFASFWRINHAEIPNKSLKQFEWWRNEKEFFILFFSNWNWFWAIFQHISHFTLHWAWIDESIHYTDKISAPFPPPTPVAALKAATATVIDYCEKWALTLPILSE